MERLLFLLTVLSCLGPGVVAQLSVKGYTGGQVHIRCEYEFRDKGRDKYFCKDEGNPCVDRIRTALKNQWVNKGRFSIFDNTSGRFFTIIYRELSAKQDSGKYFCGVKRPTNDKRTAVHLNVTTEDCCKSHLNITSYEEETVGISCHYPTGEKETSKFFCRGSSSSPDCTYTLATTVDQPSVQDENLKLYDNRTGNVLEVSMRNVTTGDVGLYWCGIQRDPDKYNTLFTSVQLALTSWCCEQTTNVTSFSVGGMADISCPYPEGYEDQEKFFCKGEHHHDCADVISINKTGVWAENGRFSCFDDVTSRRVTVKIRDLTANDSGIYWCGFDRRWRPGNHYTRVSLTVGTAPPSPPSSSGLLIPVSVSVSVVIVLVAVAIAVIIIWRRKFSHNEQKGQNMTSTTTLTGRENGRQVIPTGVIYDDVPPIGLHERQGAADPFPTGATANLPTHFSNDTTHTYYNIEETTRQARNASIGDATMPSELPVYDSVPNPDMAADSVAYIRCVFKENNGTSSGTKTVTEGNKCVYATVNHQQASK